MGFCSAFGCGETDYIVRVDFTVFYINQTTDTIYMFGACPITGDTPIKTDTLQILPNDTLTLGMNDAETISSEPVININDIRLNLSCHIFYKNANQCDYGRDEDGIVARTRFFRIENYENRKEISPLNFEFTYRFTEEVKAEAGECL